MSPASPSAQPPARAADLLHEGWDCHVHVFDGGSPVRAGHYGSIHRPLANIEALAAGQGVGRLVLVQPSVYGHDHSVLLRSLAQQPGRHRGVAAADAQVTDSALDAMHAAGVRGVRFNLVSPVGHEGDPKADLLRLAPRLRERGWHVQWYVPHGLLPALVDWQAATGLVFVLDHLAGLPMGLAAHAPAWAAAQQLAAEGAWLKLSGWYRLGAQAPFAEMHASICRVAEGFGAHVVWGSDWPHTGLALEKVPRYEDMFGPVRIALGENQAWQVLSAQAHALYGP